jgi:hypothetical protein
MKINYLLFLNSFILKHSERYSPFNKLREQENRIKDPEEQLNEQYRLRESQNDQYVKKLEQIQVFKSINF